MKCSRINCAELICNEVINGFELCNNCFQEFKKWRETCKDENVLETKNSVDKFFNSSPGTYNLIND